MRKINFKTAAAVAVLLVCILFIPFGSVRAAGSSNGVYDGGNLLTDSEEQKLLNTIEKYAEKYEADIAVVTTSNAGGKTAQAYADAYAEKIGMSTTEDGYPGILFLIDMDNREIYIATQGKAIGWYSESRIESILDNCYSEIIDGDYYDTCTAFLRGVRDYMGREPDRGARMGMFGILVRLLISLIAGGLITFGMIHRRGGRITTNAATYFDASRSHLDIKEDRFINRTVTRRHIPKPQNNGGGGGRLGGGGAHMSSGGGMHGGGGRKF
jgi:uncharacterized protein